MCGTELATRLASDHQASVPPSPVRRSLPTGLSPYWIAFPPPCAPIRSCGDGGQKARICAPNGSSRREYQKREYQNAKSFPSRSPHPPARGRLMAVCVTGASNDSRRAKQNTLGAYLSLCSPSGSLLLSQCSQATRQSARAAIVCGWRASLKCFLIARLSPSLFYSNMFAHCC